MQKIQMKENINIYLTKLMSMNMLQVKKYCLIIKKIIEQTTFTYSPLGKAFEKQTKTIEGKGKNQFNVLKDLKYHKGIEDKSDDKLPIQAKHFNELLDERIKEIQKMSDKINFNDLTYYFTSPNLAIIKFNGFRGPLNNYNETKNDNTAIKRQRKIKKNFKSSLNKINTGNPKYIKNINQMQQKILKIFIIQDKKLSIYLMIMLKLDLKLCKKLNMAQELKH